MFIVCLLILIVAVLAFTILHKKNYLLISGMYIGCLLNLVGYLLEITKTTGFPQYIERIIYLSDTIKNYILALPIPFDTITNIIICGRAIFLLFLFLFVISVSRENLKINIFFGSICAILQGLNFCIFYPITSKIIDNVISYNAKQNCILAFIIMCIIYLALLILQIISDLKRQKLTWERKSYLSIIFTTICLNILFIMFGLLGPLSLTSLSRYNRILFHILYYSDACSLFMWIIIVGVILFSTILGFYFSWQYISIQKKINKPDGSLEKKLRATSDSAKIFTHGIKNQLLAQRALLRNSMALDPCDVKNIDIQQNLIELNKINENMLQRMDELHKVFKFKSLILKKELVSDVVNLAVLIFP